jgi:hypothetical protein
MDIQFDPFSFGVATFALAVAVMQLYWNRPGAQRQNAVSNSTVDLLIYPVSSRLTASQIVKSLQSPALTTSGTLPGGGLRQCFGLANVYRYQTTEFKPLAYYKELFNFPPMIEYLHLSATSSALLTRTLYSMSQPLSSK